jgi:hypothetical protein
LRSEAGSFEAQPMMIERRKTPRSRVLQGASVVFNGRQSVMDCRIRNRSDDGLMLRMTDWIALPDTFEVTTSGNPGARLARVRWRKGDDVGVVLLDADEAASTPAMSLELERRLRLCRAENAALKHRVQQLTEG